MVIRSRRAPPPKEVDIELDLRLLDDDEPPDTQAQIDFEDFLISPGTSDEDQIGVYP